MGCCCQTPNNETIIDYYWKNLPIRKLTLEEYKDKLTNGDYKIQFSVNKDSKNVFKDYFLNENFLINKDEASRELTPRIFNSMIYLIKPDLLVFLLAFMCKFEGTTNKNIKDLMALSDYLHLDIVKFYNQEMYLNRSDYKMLFTSYILLVTEYSYLYILDYYTIHGEVRNRLGRIFSKESIRKLVEGKVMSNVNGDMYYMTHFVIQDIEYFNNLAGIREDLDLVSSLVNKGKQKASNSEIITIYSFLTG
jgi:hypothetical protein